MFDGSYPTRIIMPVTGLYSCICEVAWDNNSTGIRGIRVTQSGTAWAETTVAALSMPSGMYQHQQVAIQPGCASAGNYFQIQVYQNSGGSLACKQVGWEAPIIMACYLTP